MKGLPRLVKNALEKARDSALLAVEVYNKPAVKFKSGGYITLMVIAWTSILHAIFFKQKLKPFYKKKNGRYEKVDADYKYWELDECLRQYFKNDTTNPVRKNLEFFIPLRNRIEHRSLPEIDSSVFGECQSMLLNFDEILEKEFGLKYCLRECLSFSLQLFPSSESLEEAVKHKPDTKPVVDFIKQYRSTISPEVTASGKYSFKAFLIQVANHKTEHALPIHFVHFDKLSEPEKQHVAHLVAMVKFKEVPGSTIDTMRAGVVVNKVQCALGNPTVERNGKQMPRFNLAIHTRCWRRYKARPAAGSSVPQGTNKTYCIYDKRHNDYGYTQAWVDFLITKLTDKAEFDEICKSVNDN